MSIFAKTAEAEDERAERWHDQIVDREREQENAALEKALACLRTFKRDEARAILRKEFEADTSRFEMMRILNLIEIGMSAEAVDAIQRRMLL